jgi:hypothetical protein
MFISKEKYQAQKEYKQEAKLKKCENAKSLYMKCGTCKYKRLYDIVEGYDSYCCSFKSSFLNTCYIEDIDACKHYKLSKNFSLLKEMMEG